MRRHVVLFGLLTGVAAGGVSGQGPAVDPAVGAAEAARLAVVDRVRPAVAAVCKYGGGADGSGVLIDPDGYCLTNYHVVRASGPIMQCGLADGQLYDSVLVGQDRVGDVALVKLLPKEPGKPFPFVRLGDSDRVRVGDWTLAMGNPFGIALDFAPTVTYGLVSGVNRYQPPDAGAQLEYTDCIQFDTSINPGNSGGPLFDLAGDLVGINGRGSFDKRGRVNSGVGYAISVNQIKHFLGHLRAGLDVDHATLGALVETEGEDGGLADLVVKQVLDESDAARRGLRAGDRLVAFAGRPLTSTNQYKNILGVFPAGWRLPLVLRRDGDRQQVLVRLMPHSDAPAAGDNPAAPAPDRQPRRPQRPDPNRAKAQQSPAAALYEAKPGFANHHFNAQARDRLLAAFRGHGDFAGRSGGWAADGRIALADRQGAVRVTWADGPDGLPVVTLSRNGIEDVVSPVKGEQPLGAVRLPQGSGGLLAALYQYRRLLVSGPAGFEGGCHHGGWEPLYRPAADGFDPPGPDAPRVDCEVLRTKHAAFDSKWYFDRADGRLAGCEAYTAPNDDPCEVYFADYRPVAGGGELPHRLDVVYGNKKYAVLTVDKYTLNGK